MILGAITLWLILIGAVSMETWGLFDQPPNTPDKAILLAVFRGGFWVFAWISIYNGNQFLRKVMGVLLGFGSVIWLSVATDIKPDVSVARAYSQSAYCAVAAVSLLLMPQLQRFVTSRAQRYSDDN